MTTSILPSLAHWWHHGFFYKQRSSKAFVILTVALAVFTDVFLYGIIVPVLPFALEERADVGPDRVQHWIAVLLAVYGAALLVTSPIWGLLTDILRHPLTLFLLGLSLLAASTLLFCLSTSLPLLVFARIFQGASAALVWTVGLVLLVDAVSLENVGQAMGYVELAMSAALLASPLLGGIVYRERGWGAVWGMAFAVLGVDVLLRLLVVKRNGNVTEVEFEQDKSKEETTGRENELGESASTTEGKALDASEKQEHHSDPQSDTTNQSSSCPIHNSTTISTRLPFPIPPIFRLLANRRILSALWGTFLHSLLTTSFDATLPIFVSTLFNWDSLGAGLIFIPLLFPSVLGPFVGALSDKYGSKIFAATGFGIASVFLGAMISVERAAGWSAQEGGLIGTGGTHGATNEDSPDQTSRLRNTGIGPKAILVVLLVGVGTSLALILGPVMADVARCVDVEHERRQRLRRHQAQNVAVPQNQEGGTAAEGVCSVEDGGTAQKKDERAAYGQAYALNNMAFSAGAIAGPLLGGFLAERRGFGTACWVLATFSAVTAVLSAFFVGEPLRLDDFKGLRGLNGVEKMLKGAAKRRQDDDRGRDEGGLRGGAEQIPDPAEASIGDGREKASKSESIREAEAGTTESNNLKIDKTAGLEITPPRS